MSTRLNVALLAALGLFTVGISVAVTQSCDAKCDIRAIQTYGWPDSPYVTPDGTTLYFMYSRWNFWPTFTGGQPVLAGPTRIGHHINAVNPYGDSDIYISKKLANGKWGVPVNMGFNDGNGDCCAMGNSAGTSVYYQKDLAGQGTELYQATLSGSTWTVTRLTPLGSTSNEGNPHVNATDDGIMFESNRPGGFGGYDIWFATKTAGVWGAPVNMGNVINSAADETQVWFDLTASPPVIYFNRSGSSGIQKAENVSGAWVLRTPITLSTLTHAEVSFSDGGNTVYFGAANPTSQQVEFMQAAKSGGVYGTATLMVSCVSDNSC
jgi:hypothetical protein